MLTVRDLDDPILLKAWELFLEKRTALQIARAIQEELASAGVEFKMTREKTYDLIREARRRGYLYLSPPPHVALRQQLESAHGKTIHVVSAVTANHVAAAAAEVAARLVEDLRRKRRENVHIGLGGGMTTLLVVQHLVAHLRVAERLPKLTLHALSSGFQVQRPHTAPLSFFGLFDTVPTPIDYVGLFAPAVVPTEMYAKVLRYQGVAEAVAVANEIDIMVTSLGSASHEHGDFHTFMKGSASGFKTLQRQGWVGDVQYRPYSPRGPIESDAKIRAVALFELSDLAAHARRPDKHVVLVAGPCPACGKTRADALRPLLEQSKLRVWTHLVTDVDSARALLPE
jgi:DNA-binding transcriptional regulator LsrR (DeoR family)